MIPEIRDEYEENAREAGMNGAKALTDAVNRHTEQQVAIGIAQGLMRSHPTLQQGAIRALATGLLLYAKETKDYTDLRNEFSVKKLLELEPVLRDLAHSPFV